MTSPTPPKSYIILIDSPLEPKAKNGTKVYKFTGYDYGLARDDTVITGEEHISVTLSPLGHTPYFTVRLADLTELPPPAEEKIRVLRLLEYSGPRSWVEETISRSIQGEKTFGFKDCKIRAVTLGAYPEIMEGKKDQKSDERNFS